jgi:hypothetical protein
MALLTLIASSDLTPNRNVGPNRPGDAGRIPASAEVAHISQAKWLIALGLIVQVSPAL